METIKQNPQDKLTNTLDTPAIMRFDNTALAPNVNATLDLPSSRPTVKGSNLPSFNSQQVYPYDSSAESAYINVFTGISDAKTLTETRERAIYDQNTLSYQPVASAATGVLFPDAVTAKTNVESALRVRPTTFKGPKQLDISQDNTDEHFNRQINPRGWRENMMGEWYNGSSTGPFNGYPSPDLFYFYSEGIPTQNIQNISHAQLVDALRADSVGDFDHNEYLNTIGSLLKSDAVPYGPAVANKKDIIQTDGGGVNSDPRLAEAINAEYEAEFNLAKRIRVADATNDPRFVASAPGMQYQAQQNAFAAAQETEFEKIQQWAGIPTGFSTGRVLRVG